MTYIPQVDDYVRWTRQNGSVDEGWVYFKCDESISIEVGVKDKPRCQYTKEEKHKKIHILVCCQNFQWDQLEYVKNRRGVDVDQYKSQEGRYIDP
tara:strand:+ start:850 stop:1134 length:285 start_codon:yes stop_codon:yes gene_type:complete